VGNIVFDGYQNDGTLFTKLKKNIILRDFLFQLSLMVRKEFFYEKIKPLVGISNNIPRNIIF
jgi:hypothetical protein